MSKIKVKQLSISYGDHQVLKNVSLDIPDRQIVAVIGPSGCGKTTLLKSMNRLLDLNEDVAITGDIFIDGENIYRPDIDVTALRKRVGFLPQHPYPLPMSIFDNVAFGPKIHGLDISAASAVSGAQSDIGKIEKREALWNIICAWQVSGMK
jgi:phosphate transport system ATP-binding protein